MEILLHLGAHRCASTTFQSYLWTNRARLATRGLTCWTPKRTRDGLMNGLIRDPLKITLEDERLAARSIGRMRIEFDRLSLHGQSQVLVAEENMIGSIRCNLRQTMLYPLADERLRRFIPAFEGRKLRIALTIRSYEEYWRSCLGRQIGQGARIPTVDKLDYLTTQPRRWRHVIRDIAAIFPQAEVLVLPFERFASQPARQLVEIWNGDLSLMDARDIWLNRSDTVRELDALLALRGEGPISDGPFAADARWMPFDEDQRRALRAEYRGDLAWLAAGADGMARLINGPDKSGAVNVIVQDTIKGPQRPEYQPDRADRTGADTQSAAPIGGHDYGNEEGLGHAGAG